MIITDRFDINMLNLDRKNLVSITPLTLEEVKEKGQNLVSGIGDTDTAAVLSDLIGKTFLPRRVAITLGLNEPILVAQIKGKLPEGATTLPEFVHFKFLMITRVSQKLFEEE